MVQHAYSTDCLPAASLVAVLVLVMPFTAATKLQGPGYALFHYEVGRLDTSCCLISHQTQICSGAGVMPCRMCQGLDSRYHTLLRWRLPCPLLPLPGMSHVDP